MVSVHSFSLHVVQILSGSNPLWVLDWPDARAWGGKITPNFDD